MSGKLKLHIRPERSSILEGLNAKAHSIVKTLCRFRPKGFRFSEKYKRGLWDGWINLAKTYGVNKTYFPTGLAPQVYQLLENEGVRPQVENLRVKPSPSRKPLVDDLDGITLRDYQEELVLSITEPTMMSDGIFSSVGPDYIHIFDGTGKPTHYRNPGMGIWDSATGSGKTEAAAMLVGRLAVPTLFLVYGNDLVTQTAERFRARLGTWMRDQGVRVGVTIDGNLNTGFITVASSATLAALVKNNDKKTLNWLKTIQLLILDEAHQGAADRVQNVAGKCPAYYRIGMSGTPLSRSDGQDLKIVGAFGDVTVKITNAQMLEKEVIPPAKIYLFPVKGDIKAPRGTPWDRIYEDGVVYHSPRNLLIIRLVQRAYAEGKRVLVIFKRHAHGELLSQLLWCEEDVHGEHTFIPHEVLQGTPIQHERVDGRDAEDHRQDAIKQFRAGIFKVLLASEIFNTGLDIPEVDVLINAAGSKEVIPVKQRLGRGLRGDSLEMYDFADLQHKTLASHARERLRIYQGESCFEVLPGEL